MKDVIIPLIKSKYEAGDANALELYAETGRQRIVGRPVYYPGGSRTGSRQAKAAAQCQRLTGPLPARSIGRWAGPPLPEGSGGVSLFLEGIARM